MQAMPQETNLEFYADNVDSVVDLPLQPRSPRSPRDAAPVVHHNPAPVHVAPVTQPAQATKLPMHFCPNCGTKLAGIANPRFCPGCGLSLQ